MGLIKTTNTREYHQVKCARCKKNTTITMKPGTLQSDPRFNTTHEFVCCGRTGKAKRSTSATEPTSRASTTPSTVALKSTPKEHPVHPIFG